MNENDPLRDAANSGDARPSAVSSHLSPDDPCLDDSRSEDVWEDVWTWDKFRLFAARAVAVLGAMLLLGATLFAFSSWYTSRSEFCNSCHIMEPYYASWQHSTHSDVACVKCHFPPGAGEKLRGKMMGLVQLIKYVTQSQGPRPVAEIPDASCLRSGCHDTRLLAGRVDFQGIPFDHRPHLQPRRDKQLRCTSCHSQIVQGTHMTVTATTCYLCHFKDQHFNEGLGTCTRCHQIPEKDFELGGGVVFNHNLAYERGLDCAYCHGDLIHGNGEVPRERCSVCHNREDDLRRIDDHVFMHQVHVTEHSVNCLSCHLAIRHAFDPHRLAEAAANCAACHPNHHQEQVELVEGIGARTIPARPSAMTATRISCASCHKQKGTSAAGATVWKATFDSCLVCHDPEATQRFASYHSLLKASSADLEAAVQRVREAIPTAELAPDRATAIHRQVDDLGHDVAFLRAGNGIHNIHYATTLTRALVDQLTSLCRELHVDEPQVLLPTFDHAAGVSSENASQHAPGEAAETNAAAGQTPSPNAPPEPDSEQAADTGGRQAAGPEDQMDESAPSHDEPAEEESVEEEPAKQEPAKDEPAKEEPGEDKPAEEQSSGTESAGTESTEGRAVETETGEQQTKEPPPDERPIEPPAAPSPDSDEPSSAARSNPKASAGLVRAGPARHRDAARQASTS